MVRKFLKRGVVGTSSTLQAEGLPLVDFQRLLIQYIRSYSPYLEAFIPSAIWVRRVAHMGDRRAEYGVFMGNLMERDHFVNIGVDGKIILTFILNIWGGET
jgi:hypothetical protein